MNFSLSPWEFTLLQKYIEEQSGIVLGEEKAYFIESRLAHLLEHYSFSSYEELFYQAYNKINTGFGQQVIDAITTNETYWFRDKSPWYVLEDILLPVYIKEMQEGKRKEVHIWSSACSSGQEPYSIAMCIDNYLRKKRIAGIELDRFHIRATDLCGSMVDSAKSGKYDTVSMERGLDPLTIEKYFDKEENLWSVNQRIKQTVDFQQFNLMHDSYYSIEYDIIFCRYVLIYFSEPLKKRILGKIINALKPQGVLFIGASEIIDSSLKAIKMEEYRDGVYFRRKG